jgi:hypothetical protein
MRKIFAIIGALIGGGLGRLLNFYKHDKNVNYDDNIRRFVGIITCKY